MFADFCGSACKFLRKSIPKSESRGFSLEPILNFFGAEIKRREEAEQKRKEQEEAMSVEWQKACEFFCILRNSFAFFSFHVKLLGKNRKKSEKNTKKK